MPRFDFGKFMETGGKFAYEILSEQKSHEKKLDEIEAKLKADKEQTQATLDAGIKEGRVKGLYDFMKSDASGESKVKMWEMHSSEGLVPSLYQIQNMAATQAGQTMPGGTAGVEGLPPLRPEDVAGMGSLFEAPPEEPKKYPQTRKEVEAHEEFKAKLKPEPIGKTPEERQLDRDLQTIQKFSRTTKKDIEELKITPIIDAARNRLRKWAAMRDPKVLQRYAKDADAYFDRMFDLYKGLGRQQAEIKAAEETKKFISLMGIKANILEPYLRQR